MNEKITVNQCIGERASDKGFSARFRFELTTREPLLPYGRLRADSGDIFNFAKKKEDAVTVWFDSRSELDSFRTSLPKTLEILPPANG